MSLLMAIHQKAEAERLRSLLVDTICLLVKNGTTHVKQSITIEGVIGCTIDKGLDNEHAFITHVDRVERNDAATFALKEDPPVQPQTHNELSYNHIAVVTARKSSPPKKRKSTESIEIELPKIPRLIDVKAEDVIHIKDEPDEERSSNPKPDFFPDSALTELENEREFEQGCKSVAVHAAIQRLQSHWSNPDYRKMGQEGTWTTVVFDEIIFTKSKRGAWYLRHRDLPGFMYRCQKSSTLNNRWVCIKMTNSCHCLASALTEISTQFGVKGPGPLVSFTGEHNHPPSDDILPSNVSSSSFSQSSSSFSQSSSSFSKSSSSFSQPPPGSGCGGSGGFV